MTETSQKLDKQKIKSLRTKAHSLKPVIMIGNKGLTEAVMLEVELALDIHELIKIKIADERDNRKIITEKICTDSNAALIQQIGQISIIYRKNPDKKKESTK